MEINEFTVDEVGSLYYILYIFENNWKFSTRINNFWGFFTLFRGENSIKE